MADARATQDRADQLAAALTALSDKTGRGVTGHLRDQVAAAKRALTALWVRLYGGVDTGPPDLAAAGVFVAQAMTALTAALDPAAVNPRPFVDAWARAYSLGHRHAAPAAPGPRMSELPPPLVDFDRPVAQQAAQALSTLSPAAVSTRGFPAVMEATRRAERAVSRIEDAVAFELTRAASLAVSDAAAQAGADVLWVAERDACLSCLAYAGETTSAGGVFPTGLTFGDRPVAPGRLLMGPPLHGHCRCALDLHFAGDDDVVTALRREAQRSVLRGVALDSRAERLRAADRLLSLGTDLPKTVQERAARAVRRGEFGVRGPA